MFDALSEDVLAANMFHCITFTALLAQTMDDLINHRFGFSLYKHLYSAVPPSITSAGFKSFQEVVQTVSGQHIQLLGINEQVIMDFLGSLLSI